MSPSTSTPKAVCDLLGAQKAAIVTGDFATLDRLATALETATQRLMSTAPDLDALKTLQASANHNARLLEAAKRGLDKVAAARRGSTDGRLATYDREGKQTSASGSGGRVLSRR